MKNRLRKLSQQLRHELSSILVMVLLLAATASAQPGTISTYAGGGTFDRPALGAALALFSPADDVAVDAFGNFFIATADQRVLRVDAATGQMSSVAGNGRRDFGPDAEGDGGPAAAAGLNFPGGLAFDSDGDLYIGDVFNHRIRRVSAGGDGVVTGAADEIVSTYAGTGNFGFSGDGGPATAARFRAPDDLAFDAFDNLFVSDFQNRRIRRIDRTTGVVTTVAGTGATGYNGDDIPATSANLSGSQGIAVDAGGNLFVSTVLRVRRVDAATGIITTVAGDGDPGFRACGRPATQAQFVGPAGLDFDTEGNLLIANQSNRVMMKIDTGADALITGELDEILSCPGRGSVPGVFQPTDVAWDPTVGRVLVAAKSQEVRSLDPDTDVVTIVAGGGSGGDGGLGTAATLATPHALELNAVGDLYVGEFYGRRVRKVELNSGLIRTVAGGGSLSVVDGIPATDALLDAVSGVAVDHQGILYVSELGRSRVLRVDQSGTLTIFAGTGSGGFSGDGGAATSARLRFPQGLAVDAVGDLYIADWLNGRVRRVTAATGVIETVAGNGGADGVGLGGPATEAGIGSVLALALDAAGNLFLTSFQLLRVLRVDAATQVITVVAGTGSSHFFGDGGPATAAGVAPRGVAFDAAGNLYISDHGNQASAIQSHNLIRKVVPGADGLITGAADEIITTIAGDGTYGLSGDGGPATLASMAGPWGIALDGNQALYIADYYNQRVRRVELNTPPIADAGPDQELILGETAHFDGSGSYDPDGTALVAWDWDFGDFSGGSGETVDHEYQATGSFTVTLIVTDDAAATDSDTLLVEVVTLSDATQDLTDLVVSYNLQQGISNSLDSKLQNVQDALAAANAGNREDAANKLQAFINAVEAQRGNHLTDEQATELVALAQRIIDILLAS